MKKPNHDISPDLKSLDSSHVMALDRRVAHGKAEQYYENAMISRASVFRNQLFGRVGNYLESFDVSISVHGKEISSSCTCGHARKICKHTVALMYSWVNDAQEFLDIGNSLNEIHDMDRERLIEIVIKILQHNPEYIDFFLSKRIMEWDEIEDVPVS
jgi:hypothetical protein